MSLARDKKNMADDNNNDNRLEEETRLGNASSIASSSSRNDGQNVTGTIACLQPALTCTARSAGTEEKGGEEITMAEDSPQSITQDKEELRRLGGTTSNDKSKAMGAMVDSDDVKAEKTAIEKTEKLVGEQGTDQLTAGATSTFTKSSDSNQDKMEAEAAEEEGIQLIENPSDAIKKRSKSFEDALVRKKRRRKLRRMLREAGEFPSFVTLISSSPDEGLDENEDETKEERAPEVIYVDVDEYLGLNKSKTPDAAPSSASTSRQRFTRSGAAGASFPTAISRPRAAPNPADEGYFEGRINMASPDDSKYLSSLQQLIRNNLEYFSASVKDAAGSQAGRRTPIVAGKVGIRCIHCAKTTLEPSAASEKKNDDTGSSNAWPPGSISYPLNLANLYTLCSQKPQLHFDKCPNIPKHIKAEFYRNLKDTRESRIRSREVPAAMYYSVAAKRLGIINVDGGLRFGRDLSLEPLPLEAVLAQEQQENEEAKSQVASIPDHHSSLSAANAYEVSMTNTERTPADAASEQVLAEALAENADPNLYLARPEDKKFVTDFIFLCIRQMAICRCVPGDFSSRGKKTKTMRVGYSGFCCRHCQRVREQVDGPELARAHRASEFSCRSFSSAADNLASAISNSFALHLSKCQNVPKRLRSALAVYKRTHARQMAQLPHGSQRRLFQDLWERLRAADVSEDEMMARIKEFKVTGQHPTFVVPQNPSYRNSPRSVPSRGVQKKAKPKPGGRGTPDFPVTDDPETKKILELAKTNWDTNANGGLVIPGDRDLISDYVFLTLRNLKVAVPTAADIAKARRGSGSQHVLAGMCCMHCEKEDPSSVPPGARSFPSAPDNYASAFNTSLYNHMQNCQFISPEIKKALSDLRKIHSLQINHLEFGAQRRFFNVLFERLRKVSLPNRPVGPAESVSSKKKTPPRSRRTSTSLRDSGNRITRRSEAGDDAILAQFGFFEAPCQSFFCIRCRMVPLPFRSRGSLTFSRPDLNFLEEHQCMGDGFNLWFAVESLKTLLHARSAFDVDCVTDPLFKDMILACMGRNTDLTSIFTDEIVKVYQMSKHGGVTRAVESYIKAKSQGLWSKFPSSVDAVKVIKAFEKFAQKREGMSTKLTDHRDLVAYLLLISPSLVLPQDGEESDNDNEDETNESGHEVAGVSSYRSKGDTDYLVDAEDNGNPAKDEEEESDGANGDVENEKNEDTQSEDVVKIAEPRRGKELRKKQAAEDNPNGEDEDDIIEELSSDCRDVESDVENVMDEDYEEPRFKNAGGDQDA